MLGIEKRVYWIELLDHKFLIAHEEERHHHIPVYSQTLEILTRLGLKQKIDTDEYVLAPEMENRKRVKRIMGEGFRWFWCKKIGHDDSKVTFKSLRSTYITIATILAGDQYQLIQKHTNSDTTRKHYFDKFLAVSLMMGQDFFDLRKQTQQAVPATLNQ